MSQGTQRTPHLLDAPGDGGGLVCAHGQVLPWLVDVARLPAGTEHVNGRVRVLNELWCQGASSHAGAHGAADAVKGMCQGQSRALLSCCITSDAGRQAQLDDYKNQGESRPLHGAHACYQAMAAL
jgi:hypothetical protein